MRFLRRQARTDEQGDERDAADAPQTEDGNSGTPSAQSDCEANRQCAGKASNGDPAQRVVLPRMLVDPPRWRLAARVVALEDPAPGRTDERCEATRADHEDREQQRRGTLIRGR